VRLNSSYASGHKHAWKVMTTWTLFIVSQYRASKNTIQFHFYIHIYTFLTLTSNILLWTKHLGVTVTVHGRQKNLCYRAYSHRILQQASIVYASIKHPLYNTKQKKLVSLSALLLHWLLQSLDTCSLLDKIPVTLPTNVLSPNYIHNMLLLLLFSVQ